jgi:hypothetical protein
MQSFFKKVKKLLFNHAFRSLVKESVVRINSATPSTLTNQKSIFIPLGTQIWCEDRTIRKYQKNFIDERMLFNDERKIDLRILVLKNLNLKKIRRLKITPNAHLSI